MKSLLMIAVQPICCQLFCPLTSCCFCSCSPVESGGSSCPACSAYSPSPPSTRLIRPTSLKRTHYFNEAVAPVRKTRTTNGRRLFLTRKVDLSSTLPAVAMEPAVLPRVGTGENMFFLSTCVGKQSTGLLTNKWRGTSCCSAAGTRVPDECTCNYRRLRFENGPPPGVPEGLNQASLQLCSAGKRGQCLDQWRVYRSVLLAT